MHSGAFAFRVKRMTPTIRTGRTGFDAIRISWLFITGGEPEQGRHPKLQLCTPRGGTGPSQHRGKCVHSEVGVKGDGACQLHLRTETIGQNGCGHCKPLGIWGYVTPSKKGFSHPLAWLLARVPSRSCFLVFARVSSTATWPCGPQCNGLRAAGDTS